MYDFVLRGLRRFNVKRIFDVINIFFHERDLIDKEIDVKIGDFFSYGEVFFEITSTVVESTVYGQIEHSIGIKAVGKQARIGQIDFTPLGPTSAALDEPGAVQENFVQQRGLEENSDGETNDKRALQEKGHIKMDEMNTLEIPLQVRAEKNVYLKDE